MTRLKLFTLPLALLFATSAFALGGPEHEDGRHSKKHHDPEARVERLAEKLELDEAQTGQLKDIMAAAGAERKVIHDRYKAQIEAEVCALHEATDEQIGAILSSDQQAEYNSLKESMKDRKADREGSGRSRRGGFLPDCDADD